ncbi:hypothetical protein HOG21_06280 [bacterium]|jgi:hypothetical protein|nr:hypothetical protein [bacterium]
MMTLADANDLVTPILKSEIFKTDISLRDKVEDIKKLFEGFELSNPFKLNQFEILDNEKEQAFRELLSMYEGLTSKEV